jgi:RimJ/RimL family protein N-acetyltransferase
VSFEHRTERLLMRSWREGDLDGWDRWLNVPALAATVGGLQSREDIAAALDRMQACEVQNGFCFWALERLEDSAFIGFCGLKRFTADGAAPVLNGVPEIGWRLRQDAWGQGYAREAATATLDLAFGRFAVDEVYAITLTHNARSWGLMRRLGMTARPNLDFDMPVHGRHVTYRIGSDEWTG